MMLVLIKIVVIVGLYFSANWLTDQMGVESGVPAILAFWGGVLFLLGPYATSSGFFVKGLYVDSPTPEWGWRTAGVIMWIIGAAVLFNMASAA